MNENTPIVFVAYELITIRDQFIGETNSISIKHVFNDKQKALDWHHQPSIKTEEKDEFFSEVYLKTTTISYEYMPMPIEFFKSNEIIKMADFEKLTADELLDLQTKFHTAIVRKFLTADEYIKASTGKSRVKNKQIIYEGILFDWMTEQTQIDLLFEDEIRHISEFYLEKGQKIKVTIELLEESQTNKNEAKQNDVVHM